MLDRRVWAWLGAEDPTSFEAVTMAAAHGAVLVMPVEEFASRFEAAALGPLAPRSSQPMGTTVPLDRMEHNTVITTTE